MERVIRALLSSVKKQQEEAAEQAALEPVSLAQDDTATTGPSAEAGVAAPQVGAETEPAPVAAPAVEHVGDGLVKGWRQMAAAVSDGAAELVAETKKGGATAAQVPRKLDRSRRRSQTDGGVSAQAMHEHNKQRQRRMRFMSKRMSQSMPRIEPGSGGGSNSMLRTMSSSRNTLVQAQSQRGDRVFSDVSSDWEIPGSVRAAVGQEGESGSGSEDSGGSISDSPRAVGAVDVQHPFTKRERGAVDQMCRAPEKLRQFS